MASEGTTDRVFKILGFVGALCAPFVAWLFSEVLSLRAQVGENRTKIDNVPQLIELSMMRSELAHANEKLQKAIEVHEAPKK